MRTAGFRISASHTDPSALKTDAPPEVLWDIVRLWHRLHPAKPPQPNSVAAHILSREPKYVSVLLLLLLISPHISLRLSIDLTKLPDRKDIDTPNKPHVARYLPNPEDYWGPKARATGKREQQPGDKATVKEGKRRRDDDEEEEDEEEDNKEQGEGKDKGKVTA